MLPLTCRLNGHKWLQHESCAAGAKIPFSSIRKELGQCAPDASCTPTRAAASTEIHSRSTLLLQIAMLMQMYQLKNISMSELVLITKIVYSEWESWTAKLQHSERFCSNAAECGLIAAVLARAGADFLSSCEDYLPISRPSRQAAKSTAVSLLPCCQAPTLLPCPLLQHQPSAFPLPCPLHCPEDKVTHFACSECCSSKYTYMCSIFWTFFFPSEIGWYLSPFHKKMDAADIW